MPEWWKFDTRKSLPPPTDLETFQQRMAGGGAPFIEAYPETYNPTYRWYQDVRYSTPEISSVFAGFQGKGVDAISPLRHKIRGLQDLKSQFSGTEATFVRWLIDEKIGSIKRTIDRYRAGRRGSSRALEMRLGEAEEESGFRVPVPTRTTGLPEGYGERFGYDPYGHGLTGQERTEWARENITSGRLSRPTGSPAPVPDWMQEYITPQGGLRPFGAQAELDPEQQGLAAGYLAWSKAGSPTRYSERALKEMADWQRWWEPQTRLSKSLFPQQVRYGKKKATAFQR